MPNEVYYERKRGPMLLELIVPGQAAPAGSKTADPIMRNNPAYIPGKGTDAFVTDDGRIVGNPRKLPVLDRSSGRPMVRQRHASKTTEPWMQCVALIAQSKWKGEPLDGALWVDLLCFEKRPSTHYRTGKFSHLLRPDAPAYPHVTSTGDSGKLRRAVEDALTQAGVWADDKRVVWGDDGKDYVENLQDPKHTEPFALIRFGRMVAQTVADLNLPSPDPPEQPSLLATAT